MKRAPATCNVPGCAGVPVYRGRCREHLEWNAALTPRERGRALTERRRRLIRQRGPRCHRCLRRAALELHHRDGNPANDEPANLELLCHDCHAAATRRQRAGIG